MAPTDVESRTRPSPPQAVTPDPARSPGRRDPYFDNAKFLTIVLVACGHAWEPLTYGSRSVTALYLTVYAFHMPAFALISGYFSRGFDLRPRQVRRLIAGVVVPYLLFETLYTFFYRTAQDDPGYPLSLLDPWYVMWFLIALFVWRLTVPLWRSLRHPLPVALGVAALAACSPDIGGDLALQRVMQFLPFFVAGLVVRPEHIEAVRSRATRRTALPVAALAVAAAYTVAPWFDARWFYHRGAVTGLGAPWWFGLLSTPLLFALGLVLSVCFLAWVPGRRGWFTALGTGTLYGYLLHGFVIKASRFWDWYDRPWVHTPEGALAVTALAAAGISLLCSPPVRRLLRPAVEPDLNWAFHPDPARPGHPPEPPPPEPTARALGTAVLFPPRRSLMTVPGGYPSCGATAEATSSRWSRSDRSRNWR